MQVVVAMAPSANAREIRQTLLGAGMNCSAENCVPWGDLPVRLAQVTSDLVVIRLVANQPPPWQMIQESRSLSVSPMLVIGPANAEWIDQAMSLGIAEYVDEAALPNALDDATHRMVCNGSIRRQRGTVVSVFAPSPGSGGTTIACNLAGAMLERHPKDTALVELAPDAGEVGLLLDITPAHTVEDVCRRWQNLDATSLNNSVVQHKTGLRVLLNPVDQQPTGFLTAAAVRRIAVLSKVAFSSTVLALESRLGEIELEAMRLADHVVLVLRADVPAVRRAQMTLQEADSQGIPFEKFRLVINRWGQGGQLKVQQIEASLGLKCLQLLPDDPARVNRAVNKGMLMREVSRHSTFCRRLAALAAVFSGREARGKTAWSWT